MQFSGKIRKNRREFYRRLVTIDESWVHHYTPEMKKQSMEWRKKGENPPRKAYAVKSAGKVMLTAFWDAKGLILSDYLQKGRTINAAYYVGLLEKLKTAIAEKRPGLNKKKILLLQDNASPHTAKLTTAAVKKLGTEILDHPPYLPDLAPSDLFPKLKESLAGQKYSDDSEVISAVESYFEDQDESFYLRGIEALEHRLMKCINVQGDYVEK